VEKVSKSQFLEINDIRYHIRTWGDSSSEHLYLMHGWMDMSASFQFTVDALSKDWFVIAPDWRGFGLSSWASHGYWFPEYVADLAGIINKLSPDTDINLVGHSMGGNVAGLYTGVYPERIKRLVLAEGFGMPPRDASEAPDHLRKWLSQKNSQTTLKPYKSLAAVAKRLIDNTPALTEERALFLAQHWSTEGASGEFTLRADPKHKRVNPILYRSDEASYFWQRISCPTLWLHSDSDWLNKFMKNEYNTIEDYRSKYQNLSEDTITDSTHMMHHVQPEKFAAIIESFVS
jgi:pimeloyl-ACP methyl ester carboxylesterase